MAKYRCGKCSWRNYTNTPPHAFLSLTKRLEEEDVSPWGNSARLLVYFSIFCFYFSCMVLMTIMIKSIRPVPTPRSPAVLDMTETNRKQMLSKILSEKVSRSTKNLVHARACEYTGGAASTHHLFINIEMMVRRVGIVIFSRIFRPRTELLQMLPIED